MNRNAFLRFYVERYEACYLCFVCLSTRNRKHDLFHGNVASGLGNRNERKGLFSDLEPCLMGTLDPQTERSGKPKKVLSFGDRGQHMNVDLLSEGKQTKKPMVVLNIFFFLHQNVF